MLLLPGDGIPGATLTPLSLVSVIFLGLEKRFIFELLLFDSFSGGGPMGWPDGGAIEFGEGSGLLPFGNATFAAVAATSLLPPRVLLL